MYSVRSAANGKPMLELLWQVKVGNDGVKKIGEEMEMAQDTRDAHCTTSELSLWNNTLIQQRCTEEIELVETIIILMHLQWPRLTPV